MTVKEAAAIAGVSETVIKRWCAREDVEATSEVGANGRGRVFNIFEPSLRDYLLEPRPTGRPAKAKPAEGQ